MVTSRAAFARRAERAATMMKPITASTVPGLWRSPRVTKVAGLAATTPAFFMAMMARNRPMPTVKGDAHGARDALHDDPSQAREGDDQEAHAGNETPPERRLPRVAHLKHDDVGEVGVEPHPRRQGDRIVGDERHHRGARAATRQVATKTPPLGIPASARMLGLMKTM